MKNDTSITIKKASFNNMEDLITIENACFESPYTKDMFSFDGRETYFIIEDPTGVFGYLSLLDSVDVFEILRIAILPDKRNKGFASRLLSFCIDCCIATPNKNFLLEVRKNNIPAVNLYKKHNFVIINSRKNYYHNPTDDALIMQLSVN